MDKTCNKCKKSKTLNIFHSHINKNGTKIYSSYCVPCRQETAKLWNKTNKDKHTKHQAKWRAGHRELDNQRSKDRSKRIEHRIRVKLRSRLRDAIKKNQRTGLAIRELGCSIEELKSYLESKFQEGMTWDNYGFYGWHIDHIVPLASFDLTDPEQLRKACHYTNLQPLWAKENLSKGIKS